MGTEAGVKLDNGKERVFSLLLNYFPRALRGVCTVSEFGARKYIEGGWKTVEEGRKRYSDALARHLIDECISPYDSDSNLHHDLHIAWNALARVELRLMEEDNDSG